MYLRLSDLDYQESKADCYLTHPARSEDTDDVLIDVANQFEFTKKDLMVWVKATRSWNFMKSLENYEVDISDFVTEFDSLRVG